MEAGSLQDLLEFHFLRPWWLLAIPAWLWLSVYVWRTSSSSNGWAALCDPVMLNYLVGESSTQHRSRLALVMLMLAGVTALTALAGPVWQQLPQPVFRAQSALVIGLDLSRSMLAEDMRPNRLVRAKQKLQDVLAQRSEGQTGLIVFAGSAFDVVPLTTDSRAIVAMLAALEPSMMPSQGSRASAALEHALAMFKRGAITDGQVLLLTDGVDANAAAIAKRLFKAGHRVSVFGVGTADGAPIPAADSKRAAGFLKDAHGNIVIPRLNMAELAALAETGGGIYRSIRIDDLDLDDLLALTPSAVSESKTQSMQTDQWFEAGPWLLLLVLPLFALVFRRGVLLIVLLLPFGFADPVDAMEWQDWWQNKDQQGEALMQTDAGRAATRFEDPNWQAAALYRAGKFKQSAMVLDQTQHVDGLYNRGNALAKAGQLQQAVDSYEQVLAMDANHADARANLELVKKAMQQSENSSNQQSDQGDSSEEQGDEQQGDQQNQDSSNQSDGGKQQDQSGSQPEQDKQDNEEQQSSQSQQSESQDSDEQESQQAQQPASESDAEDERDESTQTQGKQSDAQRSEEMKASQQWLRRIPDDPGGLLKRKFLYQYRQQGQQQKETQTW